MAKKKKGTKGTGHKGSTHVASQAELNIHQRALSGKQDISTETLYDKALVAEQIKIGEDKTSSSQRKKGNVTGLNEKTNKRTTSKKDREKERDRKKAVKAYHKRNKSSRAVRRSVRNN